MDVSVAEDGLSFVANPITIGPHDTLGDVLDIFQAKGISGLPVVDESERLIGIITKRDVRYANDNAQKVYELMTRENLVTVRKDTPPHELKRILHKHRIEKLLVVDGAGKCIGIVSASAKTHQNHKITEPEQQRRNALRFKVDRNELISVDQTRLPEPKSYEEIERYGEINRLAEALVEQFSHSIVGGNADKAVVLEVKAYIDTLGERIEDLRVDLFIPRGDGLRLTLQALKDMDPNWSSITPASDHCVLQLQKLVRAHNQFVSLDETLSARDQALLGPDNDQVTISNADGRNWIKAAIDASIAEPAVAEFLNEDAVVSPNGAEHGDRIARRYSEGVRNFFRVVLQIGYRTVSYAWSQKGAIGAGGAIAVAAAKWLVANEAWFNQAFAANPTMLNTISKIVEILKALPLM